MDRQAKERLIGAIVLVAAVWLVLPVFLDGPGDQDAVEDVRELTLPQLDEQESSPSSVKRQVVVLDEADEPTSPTQTLPAQAARTDAATDEPAESGDEAPDAVVESEPQPKVEAPAPIDAAADETMVEVAESTDAPGGEPDTEPEVALAGSEPAAPAVAPGAQLWAVQIGSFSDKQNADRLAAELREAGYPAFLSQITADGRTLHRVRVGPQADRQASEAMRTRLSADGYRGRPVRHP